MNHIMAENFMRSAKAPAISAGVMMAKVSWKQHDRPISGMVLASSLHAVERHAAQEDAAQAADDRCCPTVKARL